MLGGNTLACNGGAQCSHATRMTAPCQHHQPTPISSTRLGLNKATNTCPQWDRCLSSMLIRSGLGVSFGVVFSVLLFKRRAWPAFVGLGFGAGRAWEECDNVSFPRRTNPYQARSVLTAPNSHSSEQQHPRKTASALSGHKRLLTCERETWIDIDRCRFGALHSKCAVYSRTWYRPSGQFKAVLLDFPHSIYTLYFPVPFANLKRTSPSYLPPANPSLMVVLKRISLDSLKHSKPMRSKCNMLIQLPTCRPRLFMPRPQTSSIRIFPAMPETCSHPSVEHRLTQPPQHITWLNPQQKW